MLQTRMRRGLMDRQITFIKKVIANNSFNEDETESWVQVDQYPNVWARMKQMKGREVLIADRLTYVQETVFTVDHRSDITELNRVVFNARPYEIISVIPNDESRDLYMDVVTQIVDTEQWT